ncbi:MAG: ATP-binding cassette domain-containing protein [Zetaproteobacteria bacterium]|nr:MAG: ATP-binding cassette domain-containing protein [Zetaproteobacteria bacterium]
MLRVEGLGKRYGKHWALRRASFEIRRGEAVGLLGANGAGKSTLIKCLLGLLRPSEGQVHLAVEASYLPEQPQLPGALSPLAMLRFKCAARNWPEEWAESALQASGLAQAAWERPLRQCSKGMQQRVLIAWTLCGPDSKLMLLDEPMSGLDALGRAEILSLLQARKDAGAAILMCSHIVPDMVRLCDRVLLISGGLIREEIALSDHSLVEAEMLEESLVRWQ